MHSPPLLKTPDLPCDKFCPVCGVPMLELVFLFRTGGINPGDVQFGGGDIRHDGADAGGQLALSALRLSHVEI